MANDSLASSVTSAHSCGSGGGCGNYNHRREESVIAAASALASLGVTSPTSAISCGNGSHADASSREQYYMSSTPASFPSRSHGQDIMLLSSGLTSIRPPPIVDAPSPSSIPPPPAPGQPYEVEIEKLGSIGRPLASLLRIDIPLTFPQKLMEVLSDPEIANIITWLPDGKGFIILQKRKFALDVMPHYFKHSKFTSFTRKLNRWGFSRVSRGPEMGAYYHKLFQRGNYLLCMRMYSHSTHKSSASLGGATNDTTAVASASPTSCPKVISKVVSSPIKPSSPNVTSAMSPTIELDAKRDYPMPTPLSIAARSDLPRETRRSFLPTRSMLSTTRPTANIGDNNASPFMAGTLAVSFDHSQRQSQSTNDNNTGSFYRAFSRQQEILNRGSAGHRNPSSFRRESSLQEQWSRQGDSLQHQPCQGGSMHQHQHRPNLRSKVDPAIAIQALLGVNTSSSRSHPLVIANALNALKTCNDQALTSKEHTKAINKSISMVSSQEKGMPSSYQVQSRVHAAMKAQLSQLSQLEEYSNENYSRINTTSALAAQRGTSSQADTQGDSAGRSVESTQRLTLSSRVQDTIHVAMLGQMRQFEKSSHQRATGTIIGMKATGMNGNPMSQGNVAQLHNEINTRHQQHQRDPNHVPSGGQRYERMYPRAARRASAA
eukprot:CAMPEP_0201880834 /NCGR_PEP_ID=MMETSP0902-20130614/11315_1 /ASSEMBLY_ACC=CAM_ASM_000551 /TAXON_ID=420261 /ORGANISM="Thalassiosira antarctica, Strain CCMP982" /LENGTH=659 /DNA_ID=CAMNT_0048408915 /DNA_START=177 /DNA_END=2156 /DNA_ORIENTATION=+